MPRSGSARSSTPATSELSPGFGSALIERDQAQEVAPAYAVTAKAKATLSGSQAGFACPQA